MNEHAARILIVDDNEDAASVLVELLHLSGYDARAANDGAEALRMVDAFRPECVLLDVLMPKLNGLALTQALRARFNDEIVLIAMSGFDPDDPRVQGTFELVDHYFVKPIDTDQLARIFPPVR